MLRVTHLLVVWVFVAISSPSFGGTVVAELDLESGSQLIDFGMALGTIQSITVSGTADIQSYEWFCENMGGSVACSDFNYSTQPLVWLGISSGGANVGVELISSGEFVVPVSFSGAAAEQLFSDGTGEMSVSTYVDPSQWGCASQSGALCPTAEHELSVGGISFQGSIVLTVDFDGTVSARDVAWGALKTRYR